MNEEIKIEKIEKENTDTFKIPVRETVVDAETGEELTFTKGFMVVSRKEIELQRDEAQKVVDKFQEQLDAIDKLSS